ncbi:MAG: Asp-tRNA(Asn)/Glu-tRNA(Gln) amidotransferase subunit GatB [Acidobacteria bacterium]|nr:MAG: Asp-tRNA(Asn)/Glu-tRNA(Gln) amidotransferase subunit GatB [Acidobacteriota bacterium]
MVVRGRETGQPDRDGRGSAGRRRAVSGEPTAGGALPLRVGLEIHARLATRSKLFCPCAVDDAAAPNTRICPICFGLPGALPAPPNRAAIRLAVRLALALGAGVRRESAWARKAYFYPDLPRGYQITQHESPLAQGGAIRIEDDRGERIAVPVERIHVEEDAARTVHPADTPAESLVDFNRAGVPLVEIVTAPVEADAEQARRIVERLRTILAATGVSEAAMERGALRCDVNVSLSGRAARVEVKNLNSLRAVRRAIACEAQRLARPDAPAGRETRGWDERAGRTYALRTKEGLAEYRYFPEPDLPPLVIDEALLAEAGRGLPELPDERIRRWRRGHGLDVDTARTLAAEPAAARYFERMVEAGAPAAPAASWLLNDGRRAAGPDGIPPVPARDAAALVERLAAPGAPRAALRAAFDAAVRGEGSLRELLGRLATQDGTEAAAGIDAACRAELAAHPAQVASWRAGRRGVVEFFVGCVMRRLAGRADPRAVRRRLLALLGEDARR